MKKHILLGIALLLWCVSVSGQVAKQTFTYAVKGGDTLRLDRYDDASFNGEKPCVIFAFGGGFAAGARDGRGNAAYMERLARSGYVAVAIDYRLGMKGARTAGMDQMSAMLTNSVSMAVEDFFDATAFVYANAGEWNINPDQIVASGSSAGAVTVLQGQYIICNGLPLSERLPEGFNYGGLIAFAGAVVVPRGELEWKRDPAPMMLFHGDADRNVPFDKVGMMGAGMYGSQYIARQMEKRGVPYWFYEVRNAAHEISSAPMSRNIEEIDSFIRKYVVGKQPLMIHTLVEVIGSPVPEKNFSAMDYIRANYK